MKKVLHKSSTQVGYRDGLCSHCGYGSCEKRIEIQQYKCNECGKKKLECLLVEHTTGCLSPGMIDDDYIETPLILKSDDWKNSIETFCESSKDAATTAIATITGLCSSFRSISDDDDGNSDDGNSDDGNSDDGNSDDGRCSVCGNH
jgi:hypothetical protein